MQSHPHRQCFFSQMCLAPGCVSHESLSWAVDRNLVDVGKYVGYQIDVAETQWPCYDFMLDRLSRDCATLHRSVAFISCDGL
jgi:hypothetical protein